MSQLLKNRYFMFLWTAVFVSGVGDILYTVGIMVIIFEETGSALQTAVALAASLLPIFLLGPVVGPLVDRLSRKRVMIAADLIRAAIIAILLLFIQDGPLNLWFIYAIVASLGTATAFYTPARLSILPSIVPREQLVKANSVMSGTLQGTQALGYIIGGILVSQLSLATLASLDLLSFLLSAALISTIQLPQDVAKQAQEQLRIGRFIWQSSKEGIAYLRRHDLARTLVFMEWLEHIPHGVWTSALMLVFVEEALQGEPAAWGWQNGSFYLGAILGAILATAVSAFIMRRPGQIIIVNAFLMGFLTLVYAQSHTLIFAVVISILYGPMFALRDVAQNSLLQVKVDEDKLGRVYALREMGWNFVFLLSGLIFAWLADYLSIRTIYLFSGIGYLLTAVYALSSKALRHSQISEAVTAVEPHLSS